jgi:hypothetical protein
MIFSSAASSVTLHPRGILFDMDGVLVSSLGSVERSWERWALARGIDPDLAIRTAHGRRAIETVRMLRPDLNDVEELAWLEAMEIADNVGLETLGGVERILGQLPEKYWTVVTSATEKLARSRMEQGGIRVPARIVSADEVTHGKPDPEPYRSCSAWRQRSALSLKIRPPAPKRVMPRAAKCWLPSTRIRSRACATRTGSSAHSTTYVFAWLRMGSKWNSRRWSATRRSQRNND